MNFFQTLLEALRSLASNRLRTALTMLGIVIGIASVVLMLSVGDAVKIFIDRELSVLGSNQLIVQRGAPTGNKGPPRRLASDAPWLTMEDATAIATLPSVSAASAALQGSFTVHYGDDSGSTTVLGVMPGMFKVRNWPIDLGVAFSDEDVRAANRVIVIGSRIAQAHFLRRDPLGQVIRVAGRPFTVIGVMAGEGRTLDGTDLGELMVVPITTSVSPITSGCVTRLTPFVCHWCSHARSPVAGRNASTPYPLTISTCCWPANVARWAEAYPSAAFPVAHDSFPVSAS